LTKRLLRRSLVHLQHKLPVPRTIVSDSPDTLASFGASINWRAVFKTEFSAGGLGVIVSATENDYCTAMQRLLGEKRLFIVQEYLPGVVAMRAAVGFQGNVVCGMTFEKIAVSADGVGYSTVVRPLDNTEIRSITEVVGRLFRITGPFSCDFIIHPETGAASLIEINPRATTVFHLGHLFGLRVAESFEGIISGAPIRQVDRVVQDRNVALFPKELMRDPASPHLYEALHDVPWRYPGIVSHYLAMLTRPAPAGEPH
jgi:glutathione synthase/RimK-type ligase-like ATP-grasp enzyme